MSALTLASSTGSVVCMARFFSRLISRCANDSTPSSALAAAGEDTRTERMIARTMKKSKASPIAVPTSFTQSGIFDRRIPDAQSLPLELTSPEEADVVSIFGSALKSSLLPHPRMVICGMVERLVTWSLCEDSKSPALLTATCSLWSVGIKPHPVKQLINISVAIVAASRCSSLLGGFIGS